MGRLDLRNRIAALRFYILFIKEFTDGSTLVVHWVLLVDMKYVISNQQGVYKQTNWSLNGFLHQCKINILRLHFCNFNGILFV